MYLYVMLALFLGLTLMEALGLPWAALSQVPPLDLLQPLPGGAAIADFFVLSALYGLVWIITSMLIHLWAALSETGNEPSAEAIIAAGHTRGGLEPYLWAGVTVVPVMALTILFVAGFSHRGIEALFIGGGIALAAAQALRPFRWREDFVPGVRRLFRDQWAVSEASAAAPPPGTVRVADQAAAANQETSALGQAPPPLLWGQGWLEIHPPTELPEQLVDATVDDLSREMDATVLRHGAAIPFTADQRRAVVSDLRSLLRDGHATAVAWGFVNNAPTGAGRDRYLLLALWLYRLDDGVPPVRVPEPMTVVPRWAEGSVQFRVWFQPSPSFQKLSLDARGELRRKLLCPGQAEVTAPFLPARPLRPVDYWWRQGSQYLIKETFDVNAY